MKDSDVSNATAKGVRTIKIAVPPSIRAIGFSNGGVVTESKAAAVQTPVSGYFAMGQNDGVLGHAGKTDVATGAPAGGAINVSKTTQS